MRGDEASDARDEDGAAFGDCRCHDDGACWTCFHSVTRSADISEGFIYHASGLEESKVSQEVETAVV